MSQKIYDQIGDIAMNAKGPLTINQLANKLGIINSGRNINNYIRGAVNNLRKQGKAEVAGRIEGVYTDEKGNYFYQK